MNRGECERIELYGILDRESRRDRMTGSFVSSLNANGLLDLVRIFDVQLKNLPTKVFGYLLHVLPRARSVDKVDS